MSYDEQRSLSPIHGVMERTRREKQEKEERAAKEQEEFSRLSPEVQKIIEAGDEYVRAIKAANDAIPGEEISEKIARMEMLVDRILTGSSRNPIRSVISEN